jgi:hypothetical protein
VIVIGLFFKSLLAKSVIELRDNTRATVKNKKEMEARKLAGRA